MSIEPIVITHGGAGRYAESLHVEAEANAKEAAARGRERLLAGEDCEAAAVACVRALEDAPAHNAGRGACMNAEGKFETDAGIMRSRDGAVGLGAFRTVGLGLLKNPMIVSIVLGLGWSALKLPIPGVMNDFLSLLGGAATPGALFAIGASLATKKAERPLIAGWLSFSKLVLHPGAVAFSALVLFPGEPSAAAVMIAAASLPVAGNVYILAEHYRIAPQRVSASILISTALAVVTVSLVIGWVGQLY